MPWVAPPCAYMCAHATETIFPSVAPACIRWDAHPSLLLQPGMTFFSPLLWGSARTGADRNRAHPPSTTPLPARPSPTVAPPRLLHFEPTTSGV